MSASFPRNPPSSDHRAWAEITTEHPAPAPLPRLPPMLQSPTHSQQPFTVHATPVKFKEEPRIGMRTVKAEPVPLVKTERTIKPEPRSKPGHHVKIELRIKAQAQAQVKSEYFQTPKPEPGIKLEHASVQRDPSPSASVPPLAIRPREPTHVPTHDPSQRYDHLALSRLPTEIWSTIFQNVLTTCSLGQLLLCAAVCRGWRVLILNNTDLDRHLHPFARTLGNIQATPARGKQTPARSMGENIARVYGKSKMCESCGLKGKGNKVGLFRLSNANLCLHCRVVFLEVYNHPGRPLIHNRGDLVPCSDCKRMGIPEKYVKEHMRVVATCENPHAPSSHPMKLYSVEEARRVAYAATQSLEPIRLESEPFRRLVYVGGRQGGRAGGGRRWRGEGMTYEEWEDAM